MSEQSLAGRILSESLELMNDNDNGRLWTQGNYELILDGEVAYCSLGALNHKTGDLRNERVDYESLTQLNQAQQIAKDVLAEVIREKIEQQGQDFESSVRDYWGPPESAIVQFNDDEGRTFEDIREVFTKAIKQVKEVYGDS